jgi:hypothetical protein
VIPERRQVDPLQPEQLEQLRRVLDWTRPGAHEVNRAGFELIRDLSDWSAWDRALADGRLVDRPDVELADHYRRQVDRAQQSRQAALVRLGYPGGLAGRGPDPVYALPAWPPPSPSLDTRQQVRRQVPGKRRRTLSEGVKARQRDRYKRAMADALDAFAQLHRPRRTIPRRDEVVLTPRWLRHRYDCADPATCNGCLTIAVPAPPRWRRGARDRRRDYLQPHTLSPVDWLADRALALRGCREVVALRDTACGATMVIPQSCRVRTCPDCESARQVRVVDRYAAAVEALAPERTRFLTLTVRNRPRGELVDGLAHLMDSVERLKRRAIWKGGRCRDRARCRQPADPDRRGWKLPHDPVDASMTTIEVTYNRKAGSWHPHAHLILEGPHVDQGELAEAWQAITGDSRVVWIESVRRYAADPAPGAGFEPGDVRGALRELLKYAAKPSPAYLVEQDPAPVAELLLALRGRHLTSTAGKLYGLDLESDDEEPPELVLVWPTDNEQAQPYRAPAICPLHGGPASWEVAGFASRQEARRQLARGPGGRPPPRRHVLALPAPPGGQLALH